MDTLQVLVLLTALQALAAFAMGGIALAVGGERLALTKSLVALGFAALGGYFAFSLISFLLAGAGPQWANTRTLSSLLAQFSNLLHLGLLGLALWVARHRQPLRKRLVVAVVLAALAGALILTLPGAFDLQAGVLRNLLRLGGRSLITALVYAVIAIVILRYRPPEGRSLGYWLVLCAFGLLALFNAINASLFFVPDWLPLPPEASAWLQLGLLLSLLLLAIAMLVWLQERTQAVVEARTITAERMVHLDEASGLTNRNGLLRRIEDSTGPNTPLTLLVLHVQRFALLERTLGPTWTLEALRRLGEALGRSRPHQLLGVARVDSDRLAVAIAADGSLADADVLARRREAENTALTLGHPVAVSFGYAVRQQREAAASLLASACLAQEKAEASGMRMLRFEPEQARSDADEVEIVGALYRALGEDQLFLEFQGIFEAGNGELDSVEALIRWRHPSQGLLPPGRFLPAAERNGLMSEIDAWVLDRVCRHLRERREQGLPLVPVAMNLSAGSLLDAGLVAAVETQLRRNGLPPSLLELEITESAAMLAPGRASSMIDALRALGVRVALDDLGTGYSSLSHLRDLRSDRLKIDRSFIGDPKPFGHAIAAAIATLGRSLGTDVVAEGVETPEQLAFCRAAGVPKLQGWLLHRPSTEWPPLRVALPEPAAGGDAPPI
ncbi:MAG: hypothetical protein KatS3mg128_1280 [Silanimonas sp.]|nr:MAG: hypothetical protein KatS3mg128_1280 [Silanimonas sp.]